MKLKKYLIALTTLVLFSTTAFSENSNRSLFKQKVLEVLSAKKVKMIKKLAEKVNTTPEEVTKNLQTELNGDQSEYKVKGHINGIYGVCEISGTMAIIETSVSGNCIANDLKVTIIGLKTLTSLILFLFTLCF